MYLLDTHVLFWSLAEVARLTPQVRTILDESDTRICVSVASAWEMRIKSALGKMTMPEDLPAQLALARFETLPITLPHALAAGGLPLHHRDPFDRMLIAQAQVEGLTLVTHDARMRPYDVAVLWA